MRTNKFSIGRLIDVDASSIVNENIRTILIFLQKNFERTKTQIKQKSTNKTKTSKKKTIKATIFHAEKLLRGEKLFILSFLKKLNCPDNFIYYTTNRKLLNKYRIIE